VRCSGQFAVREGTFHIEIEHTEPHRGDGVRPQDRSGRRGGSGNV